MRRRITSLVALTTLLMSGVGTAAASAETEAAASCSPSVSLVESVRSFRIVTNTIAYDTCGQTLRLVLRWKKLPHGDSNLGSMVWINLTGAGTVSGDIWRCTSLNSYDRRNIAVLKRGTTEIVAKATWVDSVVQRPFCAAI